jgi:hypothetical protein
MLKYLLTTLLTAAITVATTLIAVDFQHERLVYALGAPTQLGDLTHQQLRIFNRGGSPALNVKIAMARAQGADLQATLEPSPPFDLTSPVPGILGGYERLRRSETAVIDLTFRGPPLRPDDLTIKSDETIAAVEGSIEAQTVVSQLASMLWPRAAAEPTGLTRANCGI